MADRHSPGYNVDFRRNNYDTITLTIPKGKKILIREAAEKRGESMNSIIVESIESYLHINLTD